MLSRPFAPLFLLPPPLPSNNPQAARKAEKAEKKKRKATEGEDGEAPKKKKKKDRDTISSDDDASGGGGAAAAAEPAEESFADIKKRLDIRVTGEDAPEIVKDFSKFPTKVQALLNAQGFTAPTPIQMASW